jgi:hypothetical protein
VRACWPAAQPRFVMRILPIYFYSSHFMVMTTSMSSHGSDYLGTTRRFARARGRTQTTPPPPDCADSLAAVAVTDYDSAPPPGDSATVQESDYQPDGFCRAPGLQGSEERRGGPTATNICPTVSSQKTGNLALSNSVLFPRPQKFRGAKEQ